jgi:hypothetical protein
MTQLERDYFDTFTLERLKAFYKAVAKEAHCSGTRDPLTEYPICDGASYVTRVWIRPGDKKVTLKLNKKKIRQAIKEREKLVK